MLRQVQEGEECGAAGRGVGAAEQTPGGRGVGQGCCPARRPAPASPAAALPQSPGPLAADGGAAPPRPERAGGSPPGERGQVASGEGGPGRRRRPDVDPLPGSAAPGSAGVPRM